MAKLEKLVPLILKWEGGYVNDPADLGGATNKSVNNYPDPEGLFEKIKQVRRAYLNMICIDRPANKRFLKGWLNRLNDFKWISMALCFVFFFACKTSDCSSAYCGKFGFSWRVLYFEALSIESVPT